MSMYSFSREGSAFSAASICGSTRTGASTTTTSETIPEDPSVSKCRKKLYGITARKAQQKPLDTQLVMFDPEVIHFPQWKDRFYRLLESREIEDEETRKKILYKALLPKTVELIPTLFRRHEEPAEKDTDTIISKLQEYYHKIERKDRIKARIRFFSSVQGGKHFYEFAVALKDQLFDCDFGSFEEDALVMCFVNGLDNPILRKHLLEKELWLTTLIDTVELALKFQEVLPSSPLSSSESIYEMSRHSPSRFTPRNTMGE